MNADRSDDRDPPPPGGARGLRAGRVLGVPVYINASWLLLAGVVIIWYGPVAQNRVPTLSTAESYAVAAGFVACLLLSVLLHEIGHAVTARRFGIGVRAITL